MSRTTTLTQTENDAMNDIINNINVLDNRYYETVDNSDGACFYYPEPNGQPVRFRGQCDETIPVFNDFDAAAYMGFWYDVGSYPQAFQDGTCPTATYTLKDGVVLVNNTQVVAQQLDTINGTAVVSSTDGSAKLSVTFPIAGTTLSITSPYWVLSTDYDNYALVYSCTDIDEDTRSVSAWKLSRERTLPSESESIIDNIMNTIPVLRQQYFVEREVNDEGCFFYPDNYGGPVYLEGQCPADEEVNVVTGLNLDQFAGTWHQMAYFPSELEIGDCGTEEFVVTGNTFTITQTAVNDETLITLSGTGTLPEDGSGIITATLTGDGLTTDIKLYVLGTDYTDYALLYSCRNINDESKQIYSWKLSRSRSGFSNSASIEDINTIVDENEDLFALYYEETQQNDDVCFYYPVFDVLPSVIEFPGPCSVQNVQGIADFDVAAYTGRWFEIERYPQPSQQGQCSRAVYSVNDGAVELINSEVNDKVLRVVDGSVRVVSDDNSAVLEVTINFEEGGQDVANLVVVDTDYITYSLVYSCRDLETGNSQVASWKLSRSKTLNDEANIAINNAIAITRGLSNTFYTETSQTDEDCFYVPEMNPNAAPLFRGQCEDITGMANFEPEDYIGWWHEIERYPSDNELGECISSQYSSSNNQYQVVDTNVFEDTAQVDTNAVTIDSTGRLTKTLSNGNVINMWVLSTDYDTYSLLYSCVNVNDEYRRVWSAKHSKSRSSEFPQEANEAMTLIIDSNEVLYPQFYLPVDQSDEACFYYPEPTGNPVILPGQCDENLSGLNNFDVEAYTGTWYQIERYPQTHESGSCTGARYTLNEETSVVDVLNWEVIGEDLSEIEGNATVASSDGSAKLTVILDSQGVLVESELYVLATDYISYSLAYSCMNVNQFQRQVAAWKLSRHRTMPEIGNTAINQYMAQREELHQPYFIQVEQNEECQEPSSAVLIRSSILIMIVCFLLQKLL